MKTMRTAAIVVGAIGLAWTGAGLIAGGGLLAGISSLSTIASLGTGISSGVFSAALTGAALTTGLGIVQGVLPEPSQGGSQTKWKADLYAGLPYVMGRTLASGNIVYRRGHGKNNELETFVTVPSIGPIESIDTTFLNRTTVSFDASGNAIGTYDNDVWQRVQLGRCPEPAALVPPKGSPPGWTPAHKLSGLCAIMNTFLYDAKGKNTLTTEPTPAWIGHWVKVWDPVQDSTYPGGSGPCRALQEETYVWSDDPHLHALTWALGRWQNGKRVAGFGAPLASIDVASFVEGRNLNKARGWKIGGQVVTRPDTPWNSLKAMLQAGGAKPVFVGGIISCVNQAPRVSLATITRDDIVGESTFSGTQPRRSRINGIIPSYRSEAHDWETVPAAIVTVPDYVALDGDERTRSITYPLVQDVDQVAQLAAYDICDAREAGPGTVPLKPWWFNYRIGDCVTFSPEDGWSVKVLITGRTPNPENGTVSYEIQSETDDKHPFALGLTGTAPPTAGIRYDDFVAAPAPSDWAITAAALQGNGSSQPALVVEGNVENPSADAVLFAVRSFDEAQGNDDGWTALGQDSATTVRKVVTEVASGGEYEISVQYRVRGVIGERLILGPVTAGALSIAGALQMAVSGSWIVEVTAGIGVVAASADGTITIDSNTRRYNDGYPDVTVAGATIASGLAPGSEYSLAYDDPARLGGAVTYALYADDNDAHPSASHPGRHYMGYVKIPATGTSTGGGGGVGGGRANCVVDTSMVLMANEDRTGPGVEKMARDLVAGDWVWTQREVTFAWGAFRISDVSFAEEEVLAAEGYPRATADHRFREGDRWVRMSELGTADGRATVARITVAEGRTIVTDGVLSHNIKMEQSVPNTD